MGDPFAEATERAIAKLVTDFQGNSTSFWNERDLHWSLFYYLKQEGVVPESYPTQLIRAERPTVKMFGKARGHYDLAILDPESFGEGLQRLKEGASFEEFFKVVKIRVAVEVKLWRTRLPLEKAKRDIRKLTEQQNNVLSAYFLNFIQLDFTKQYNRDSYRQLKEDLMRFKIEWPYLKILCLPIETRIQPNPNENWLSPS